MFHFRQQRRCLLFAISYRAGPVHGTSGLVPASDFPVPVSGFDRIRSGEHSGPDVRGAPGEGRILTQILS